MVLSGPFIFYYYVLVVKKSLFTTTGKSRRNWVILVKLCTNISAQFAQEDVGKEGSQERTGEQLENASVRHTKMETLRLS